MTDAGADGVGMPDLVQAPSERAIHTKLADPNCPVREVMASFNAAIEENVSLSDPALKYVRSDLIPKCSAMTMM